MFIFPEYDKIVRTFKCMQVEGRNGEKEEGKHADRLADNRQGERHSLSGCDLACMQKHIAGRSFAHTQAITRFHSMCTMIIANHCY